MPGGGLWADFASFYSVNGSGDLAIGAYYSGPAGITDAILLLENCGIDQIFLDGFEDGTLNAWSAAVP